tara:strand:+ start:349 stop:972 length:624 start_codon:yes stop_codon:yes gene_type:complete
VTFFIPQCPELVTDLSCKQENVGSIPTCGFFKFNKGWLMKAVQFYKEEIPNNNGVTLSEMMKFSPDRMESDHGYIQWMFPSNEASMFNVDAPLFTPEESEVFKSDAALVQKISASFTKFLEEFLGLSLQEGEIVELEPTECRPDPQWWMRAFNHNMLRITRILKCLRLVGLEENAIILNNYLQSQDCFSDNTKSYWSNAVFGPLWDN